MGSVKFPKPKKLTPEEKREAKRKKAKRRAAPMSWRDLETLADRLHSIYVRANRDGCEMAGYPHHAKSCPGRGIHPSELQCAHGWDRGAQAVRFDLCNTFALCPSCHVKYTRNHRQGDAQWHDWMALRIGESVYQELRARARPLRQWSRGELLDVIKERLEWIHTLKRHQEWAEERVEMLASLIRKAFR